MRKFKFVGDTVHRDPNNPPGINFEGVYFALDKPTDCSDEIGLKLEGHSHFQEVGAGELDTGDRPGAGGENGKPAKKAAKKSSKKRVSKKKRASKKA